MLTKKQIEEIKARRKAAMDEVIGLCRGDRRWLMSIPVQEDDSDRVISAAMDDLRHFITDAEQADVARTPDDAMIQSWIASLELAAAAFSADLNYDEATTFCTFCPGAYGDCCKNREPGDPAYFYSPQELEGQERYAEKIKAAKAALKALLSDE